MTEKDISTILEHAVPVEPGLTGLGDRVRDGHRRRRMVRAGVVVVGALALGVPVALNLVPGLGGPTVFATPSATDVPSGVPSADVDLSTDRVVSEVCEQYSGTVSGFPDARIPDGVTRIYLCGRPDDFLIDGPLIYGAPEPIVGDLSGLVDLVNDQPAREPMDPLPSGCPSGGETVSNLPYTAVFEYPDGTRLAASSTSGPCSELITDRKTLTRGDGGAFFLAALEALHVQRQDGDYGYVGDDDLCMEASSIVSRSMYDVVRGAACATESGDSSQAHRRVVLPDALVARIRDEAVATADLPPDDGRGFPLATQTLVLQSAHGDPMTMYRWPDGSFSYWEDDSLLAWTPSAQLAAEIADVFEGLGG